MPDEGVNSGQPNWMDDALRANDPPSRPNSSPMIGGEFSVGNRERDTMPALNAKIAQAEHDIKVLQIEKEIEKKKNYLRMLNQKRGGIEIKAA